MSSDEQKEEIEQAGSSPIFSYNQTDFVKDRVAIEVQFGKYSFVAYDLFVKHLAFYMGDKIDVGIEILPMKQLQSHQSLSSACSPSGRVFRQEAGSCCWRLITLMTNPEAGVPT